MSVALDEADAARPFVDEAKPTYTVVVDPDHALADTYGLFNVPSVVWIDEDDHIVRPPDIGYGDNMWKEFTGVDADVHLDEARAWVREGVLAYDATFVREHRLRPTAEQQQARVERRIAAWLARHGHDEAAQRHLATAADLAPMDWTIRRGGLPLAGGDPFGAEFFAFMEEWQNEGSPGYGWGTERDSRRADRAVTTPEPFTIAVPDDDLDDLRRRLRATRYADDFENDDWRFGTRGGDLERICRYWADEYDWRAQEREMNRLDNYRVVLDDVPIHFFHARSANPDAIPLVLTHGWPWTFWDMHALAGLLTDAFHVVVPSLPGYAFSSPLRHSVSMDDTVDLWARLMTDVLGYERFGAAGGDWGAAVSLLLGHAYPERVIAVHATLPAFPGLPEDPARPDEFGPEEQDWPARSATRMKTARSHISVHRHDPQTLAYALNDSPAGLASWILERRRAWSDCADEHGVRDVERAFTLDHLCTTFSLFWLTQTIGTSMRYYVHGFRRFQPRHDRSPVVPVPTAMAVFPDDLMFVPRKTAERFADIVQWTLMPAGGHFAHAEQPELVSKDLHALFAARS